MFGHNLFLTFWPLAWFRMRWKIVTRLKFPSKSRATLMKFSMKSLMKKVGLENRICFSFDEENFSSSFRLSGSSVIRLLHSFIGKEAFRQGLAEYLQKFSYKNTITDNLWFHLSKTSKRSDLTDVLSTWTKQMGYPLLTVGKCFDLHN